MDSYFEMLEEARVKRVYGNTSEDNLKDIATLLAMLCDEIHDLRGSVNSLDESVSSLG